MWPWILLAVILVLLFIWLLSSASKPKTNLNQISTNEPVTLEVGQNFVLELPATPSTGYTWTDETPNNSILTTIQPLTFVQPDNSMPGASGNYVVVYQAATPGQIEVRLAYGRPWLNEKRITVIPITVNSM